MAAPRLTHQYQRQMRAMRAQWEPPLARDVAAYLRGALARALAAVPKALAPVTVSAPSEAAILRRTLGPWYRRALGRLQDTAEGMGIAGELHDVATAEYLARAGTRVGGIAETTRQQVTAALADGYAAHEGYAVLARRLTALPAFSPARARLVARTELGSATNLAALYVYDASPAVDGVLVYDGTGDPACAALAGTRWSLADARTLPQLGHPACLPGDSLVLAPNLEASFSRRFDGEVVILRTAAHDLLTCTPNHPILTTRGWVAAGLVRQGEYVVRCLDAERVARLLDPDHDHVPARIEQVANALGPARGGTAATMPMTPEAFHGDGTDSEVYVVRTDGRTETTRQAAVLKHPGQRAVVGGNMATECFPCGRRPTLFLRRGFPATRCRVGGGTEPLPAFRADVRHAHAHGIGLRATDPFRPEPGACGRTGDAEVRADIFRADHLPDIQIGQRIATRAFALAAGGAHDESSARKVAQERGLSDADTLSDGTGRLPGLIAPVQVVEVERRQFSGHVYNLQTTQGWYVANSIITHNCRRSFAPLIGYRGGD